MNDIVAYCRPERVLFITLGCSKNRVDSEHILQKLSSAGIRILPQDYELTQETVLSDGPVDAVVINTCGFIHDAKTESVNTILEAVNAKNLGFVKHVFVFGCLSQRYRDELKAEIPEVDAFFGVFDYDAMLNLMCVEGSVGESTGRYVTTPSHYAYLKISEGCNRRCSYCSIPYIRGKHISVPMERVLEEAAKLAAKGVRELIVIAQDTTYYGLDLYGKRCLGELLEKLSAIRGIEWIRLHYSYPAQFPEDVLRVMAENSKICKYLDIPLQHSSSKVLASMKREIDGPQTQRIIDRIRKLVPGVVLRTTMIVGFPTEGSREFEQLLRFVAKNKFERLGAFTYSEEEGTYGAATFKDRVRAKTKQRRYDRLMELQSGISLNFNENRIGGVEKVIVDSFSDGVFVARSQYESPEVDGEILIGKESAEKKFGVKFDPLSIIGTFVQVRIVGANEYDLIAELV